MWINKNVILAIKPTQQKFSVCVQHTDWRMFHQFYKSHINKQSRIDTHK